MAVIDPKCPRCADSKTLYTLIKEKPDQEAKYLRDLRLVQKIKIGNLFVCPACSSYWFHEVNSGEKEYLTYISEKAFRLLKMWGAAPQKFSEDNLKALQAIGATPPDIYGNGSEHVSVPCKCYFDDGTSNDKCIVRFMKKPLIGTDWNYGLAENVVKIEPSIYGVTKELRLALSLSSEVRMGYSPSRVKTTTNEFYIINGTPEIFSHKNIKGSQLGSLTREECERINSKKETAPFEGLISDDVDYKKDLLIVIADWFEGCEKLRVKHTDYVMALSKTRDFGSLTKRLGLKDEYYLGYVYHYMIKPTKKIKKKIIDASLGKPITLEEKIRYFPFFVWIRRWRDQQYFEKLNKERNKIMGEIRELLGRGVGKETILKQLVKKNRDYGDVGIKYLIEEVQNPTPPPSPKEAVKEVPKPKKAASSFPLQTTGVFLLEKEEFNDYKPIGGIEYRNEVKKLNNPQFLDYFYYKHPKEQLQRWAKQLNFFRFVRACGGHANDNDSLMVKFIFNNKEQLKLIFNSCGLILLEHKEKPTQLVDGTLVPGWGWMEYNRISKIQDVRVDIFCRKDSVCIAIINQTDFGYFVSDADVVNASKLESLFDPLKELVVDPPKDIVHCICPKYYPHFFDGK